MTVAELMAQLRQLPPEAEVYFDHNPNHTPMSVGVASSESHWANPDGPYIVVLRED